jgi:hypothetical protein
MARRKQNTDTFSLFAFQDIITSVTGIMIFVTLMLALEMIEQWENSPSPKTRQVVSDIRTTMAHIDDLKTAVAENQSRIEDLQRRLDEGTTTIDQLAGLDPTRMANELDDVKALNHQLNSELGGLEREVKNTAQREQQIRDRQRAANDSQVLADVRNAVKENGRTLEKLKNSNRVIFNPALGNAKMPWLVEITADKLTAAKVGEFARPRIFQDVVTFKGWTMGLDRATDYFVILVKPDGIQRFEEANQFLRNARFDVGYDLLTAQQSAIDPETGAALP